MSFAEPPQPTTRMFARVLGPFFAVVSVVAAARTTEMSSLLSDFAANTSWSWSAGPFVLVGGLIIIALHSNWHGPAAVVVSISGWLIALRGLLLVAFPTAFMSMARWVIESGDIWRATCIVFAAIGLYLTYVGWMPTTHRPAAMVDVVSGSEIPS
ncbi:hypothetical protein GCM10009641_63610 [Mycobacterium cookii]|uniref:Uncharacterized protein n=1 Tax=Mycobacterium cookii TaxID=1775 RepID=A0A7I7KW33_9MYCO|nr:hypothetical protein [Mycobacterium cookii]MCV7329981.1 hypothetical protein [Mycobacterium cookii]BBX45909.1 hypothetical protein MCOO_19240 [Mycobacterium cookii]